MREHAAAVDVRDQQHRAVRCLGEAHVGDIALAQVDLGGRARAFHDDGLILRRQSAVRSEHRVARRLLVGVVLQRFHVADGAAVDDDLRAGVAVGLEQHRIHVGVRREPRRLRLHCLRAPDLAAV